MRVITSNGDDLTDTSDPTRKMMRQIAGAFAEYEKARLVARLRRAREVAAEKRGDGKVSGRKSIKETNPEIVALAKRLRRKRSLREVSAELAKRGHVTSAGKPFSAMTIYNMVQPEAKRRGDQKRGSQAGTPNIGA